MRIIAPLLVGLCRWFVGLLFLVSGLIKVNDPKGFLYKIEEYIEVFHSLAPSLGLRDIGLPLATPVALGLAVLEVAVAVLLLLGVLRGFTTWLLLILILLFTALTGYSAVTGAVTDCGCFGEVLQLTPLQSFIKDLVLFVLIGVVFTNHTRMKRLVSNANASGALAAGLIAITAAIIGYTFTHLPLVDFSAFAIGKSIPEGLATRKPNGEKMIKDYLPTQAACGYDEFKGTVIWIVARDLGKLSEAEQASLTQALTLDRAIVLTSSGSDARAAFAKQHPKACLVAQDLTLLKTMMRADLGYLLLVDGVVKLKQTADAPLTISQDVTVK
jgi:uncharacterized membrane protein YphA (DoxX/SURF4 family)